MDDAVIGKESLVAAMAFVKAGFDIPARSMVVGNPAQIKRELSDKEVQWKSRGTAEYQELTRRCLTSLAEVEPLSEVQDDRPRFSSSAYSTKD
jgi:phenylacetic acid degradation protein